MKYIMAHDFGTSADKAVLFTTDGAVFASYTAEYQTSYGADGEVEQNPHTWWRAFCESSKHLLINADAEDVICVSFDGTSPNCLCVDENMQPLHRAMMWQDNRAAGEAERISALLPEHILMNHPGKRIATDRTLAKLLWIREHRPEVFRSTWKVLPCVSNYIIMRLTGRIVCDTGVGRTTAMLTPDNLDWSDEVMGIAGISRDILPELVSRTDIVGKVPENMTEACGLAVGTPIVCGSVDYACTNIGAGILNAGDAFICGGTSASIEGLDQNGHKVGRPTAASGASLNWAKNQLCGLEQVFAADTGADVFELINRKIEQAPVGSNGVIFHPYLAGARSVLDNPKARGGFFGLTLTNTKNDMLRSVAEGIGFNLNLILQSMRDSGMKIERMPIVGGLAKGAVVRQIFADIMDVELYTYENAEVVTAAGAAILGGIAMGVYEDERAYEKFMKVKDVTRPIPENHEKYAAMIPVYKELYDCLCPVYEKM